MDLLITYYIMYGNYIFQTKCGEIQFNKDKMVLPYIDTNKRVRGLRINSPGEFWTLRQERNNFG